jgi:hypothetical protein
MRKTNRLTFWATLSIAGALILIVACVLARAAPVDNVRLNYWLGVFSGNWSVRTFQSGASFAELWEYWLGVILALSFNIGAISLLVTLVGNITFVKRSYAMNLMQAFSVREADIKHEILENVPERDFETLRPIIERAFTHGAQIWREQTLVTLLGNLGAKHLLESLERTELREQD